MISAASFIEHLRGIGYSQYAGVPCSFLKPFINYVIDDSSLNYIGASSEGEAVRFMVEEGFQEQAQAEKKLRRAKLDSTQLSQYFLGLDEILQLEKEVKASAGTNFRQREFNEKLTGHGSIAVKHLRRYFF